MRINFANKDLYDLFYATKPPKGLSLNVLQGYQKIVNFIKNTKDLQDIRSWKSLHFEKLKGDRQGQYSIAIDKSWRIILTIEKDKDGNLILILELTNHYTRII